MCALIFPFSAVMSYAMIVKLLRTIKNTEDASPDPLTEHVHLMCDISLVLAKSLIKHVTREDQLTLPKVPGGVPLPQQFFKSVSDRRQGKKSFVTAPRAIALVFCPEIEHKDLQLMILWHTREIFLCNRASDLHGRSASSTS